MIGYGLFFWLPSFFVRSYGMSLLDASLFFGAIVLIGGLAGIWIGGALADRYGQRNRSAYALIPAIALLSTLPFYVVGVLSPSLVLTFFVLLVPTALGLVWLAPVIAAIQHMVQPNMRATASAVFLFINNLVGIGAGTVLFGALSDALESRFAENSLRYSILAGSVFYIVAAMFFIVAARGLARDWENGRDQTGQKRPV